MPDQPLSILDYIIQKREADHLLYANMNEFTVLSDAVFLRVMNVLFIHGRAFAAIVNIRVLEHDEMLAHIFKFADVDVMRGCIQDHMAISVSEHLTGTCQALSPTACIRLFGGRSLFACHWVFLGLPFSPPQTRSRYGISGILPKWGTRFPAQFVLSAINQFSRGLVSRLNFQPS
jgi:hypothetical protein